MTFPAMILAAGFGTRMGKLTADRPKPLISVAGRALLDHALEVAEIAGGPIAVNAHYRADQIAAHLADRPVHLLREEPDILDSGGGVRNALSVLGPGPLVTINADTVWAGSAPVENLRQAWDPSRMDALLLVVPMARAVGRQGEGDFTMECEGRLREEGKTHVYTGVQILGQGVVERWPEGAFSMWEIWRAALAAGRLYGCEYPGSWADVGHPDGIAAAEAMVAGA